MGRSKLEKSACAQLAGTLEIQLSEPSKVGGLACGGSHGGRGVVASWWGHRYEAEDVESEGSEFGRGTCFAAGQSVAVSEEKPQRLKERNERKVGKGHLRKVSLAFCTWVLAKEPPTDLWDPPLQDPCSWRWAHSKP